MEMHLEMHLEAHSKQNVRQILWNDEKVGKCQ